MLGFRQLQKNFSSILTKDPMTMKLLENNANLEFVKDLANSVGNISKGTQGTKAEKQIQKYLSPWPREVTATRVAQGSAAPKRENVPVFVLGKAGQIAMKIWRKVATVEGTKGLARTELELSVFLRFYQKNKEWKELVHTADAFVSMDKKLSTLKHTLNSLGCSEKFFNLLAPIFKNGDFPRLEQIYVDFSEINRSFRREVDVTLITGKKLDRTTLEFYKSTINLDFLDPADNMIFAHSVDPTIIGYKVLIGNKVHDFSHTDEKNAAERRIEAASHYSPRDELFRSLEGVMSPADIEKLWNALPGPNKQ